MLMFRMGLVDYNRLPPGVRQRRQSVKSATMFHGVTILHAWLEVFTTSGEIICLKFVEHSLPRVSCSLQATGSAPPPLRDILPSHTTLPCLISFIC